MAGWDYNSNDKYKGMSHEFVAEYKNIKSSSEFICDKKNLCRQIDTGKKDNHGHNEWFYDTFKYKD